MVMLTTPGLSTGNRRMKLMSVQIDHGRVDTEPMKQDTERLRLDVQRAIKTIAPSRDGKLLTIEIWKLVVGAAAAGAALWPPYSRCSIISIITNLSYSSHSRDSSAGVA
jgi:hypothetical protein